MLKEYFRKKIIIHLTHGSINSEVLLLWSIKILNCMNLIKLRVIK